MPQHRTLAKLIRLTPDEFADIERRARAAGQLPARFIRACVLGSIAAPPPAAAVPAELLHSLASIGADLRTLVRRTPDEPTRADAMRVLTGLVAVLHQLTGRPVP
jgi:hypothetical protein